MKQYKILHYSLHSEYLKNYNHFRISKDLDTILMKMLWDSNYCANLTDIVNREFYEKT